MKSILVNQEINRRNLEDLVSIRQSTFISQIATATVVALLRVVIFDFTALCRINKFSGMTGMAGLAASLSSGSLAASMALGLSARIRRWWFGAPFSAGQALPPTLGSFDTASQGSSLFVRTSFATDKQIKLRPGKPGLPAPSCRGCRLRRNLSTQAEELLFVSVDHERSETHEPHKVQTAKLSSDPGNFYLEGEGAVLRVTDG